MLLIQRRNTIIKLSNTWVHSCETHKFTWRRNLLKLCSNFDSQIILYRVRYTNKWDINSSTKVPPYRVCSRENREWESPGKWAKNQNRENREIETDTKFGNWAGIIACKVRFRLLDENLNNLFQACSYWNTLYDHGHTKISDFECESILMIHCIHVPGYSIVNMVNIFQIDYRQIWTAEYNIIKQKLYLKVRLFTIFS